MSKCIVTNCRNEGWGAEPIAGATYCFTHTDVAREDFPGMNFRNLKTTKLLYGAGRYDFRAMKVYFLQAPGLIKIGSSMNPLDRIRMIRSGFENSTVPVGLESLSVECIGFIQAPRTFESELHTRYAHLQIAGEWFKATPELEADIESLLAVNDQDRSAA